MNKRFHISKLSMLICILCLFLLCIAVCAYFSWYCAAIIAGLLSIAYILIIAEYHHERHLLSEISDDIDRVLLGQEQLNISDSIEGDLGILIAEIHKMTIQLREQNKQLQHSHSFMKESLEDISHQLRTPLTSMMLLVNFLSSRSLSDSKRLEYVQELALLNNRMQWLIETLLKISRLDADVVQFQKQKVVCKDLMQAAIQPLSVSAELKNVTISSKLDDTITFIGDFERNVEAISNILKNCLEHTPENGTITVSAEQNTLYTQILICDTGNGISEKDLPHIFERFYRSSDFAKSGYGIGLAFAHQIIAKQNGSLSVKNHVPHGAEFCIRFYSTTV